jgi:hypothetical protein
VSDLVGVEAQGDNLSDEELTANVILLFIAGHETTSNAIGNSLRALHLHPDQLRKIKDDPGRLPGAVQELLRYDSPVQLTSRSALDTVELHGKIIEKGDFLVASLGAANRDPDIYPNPDQLDVSREDVRPLSFGGGIHFCLGALLANIELEVALAALLAKLPNLKLPDVERPNWRPSCVWRGLQTLRAEW